MAIHYKKLLNESRRFKRMLKEAYGDDMPQMGGGQDEEMFNRQRMGQGDQQMSQGRGQQMGQDQMLDDGEGAEGMEMEEQAHDNVIDQIRQLAIKGIAQYADDIESEQYQSLKKIWLLTDKFYEGLEGEDGNNNVKK